MQNHKLPLRYSVALSGLLLALCTQVSAQTSASATAMELQLIAERTAVLEAKLKYAEMEAKLNKLNAEAALAMPVSSLLVSQQPANAKRFTATPDSFEDLGLPSVVQVEGVKGRLEAVLAYSGNIRHRVKEGDKVSNYQITKISVNEVTLTDTKTKALHRLSFSASPVTRQADTGSTGFGAPLPGQGVRAMPGQTR